MDTLPAPTPDWRAAVWDAHRAGRLTRAARDVLLTLATFRGPGGRIWPSHALLAARAACCSKTVLRAMQQARAAGLLAWRAIRWRTPGGYWRQSSNLYALRLPAAAPDGHSGREGEKPKIPEGSRGRGVARQLATLAVGNVQDARAALAAAAKAMQARLLARRHGVAG